MRGTQRWCETQGSATVVWQFMGEGRDVWLLLAAFPAQSFLVCLSKRWLRDWLSLECKDMDTKKYAETYVQELVANSTFKCAIATRGLVELNLQDHSVNQCTYSVGKCVS